MFYVNRPVKKIRMPMARRIRTPAKAILYQSQPNSWPRWAIIPDESPSFSFKWAHFSDGKDLLVQLSPQHWRQMVLLQQGQGMKSLG